MRVAVFILWFGCLLAAGEQPTRVPAGILITGATLWIPDRALDIKETGFQRFDSAAFYADVGETGRRILILDLESSRNPDKPWSHAQLIADPKKPDAGYLLDEKLFIGHLKNWGLSFPDREAYRLGEGVTISAEQLRDSARSFTVASWPFFQDIPLQSPDAKNRAVEVPSLIGRILLMDWGRRDKIGALADSLHSSAGDGSLPIVDGARIYRRLFYRIPIQISAGKRAIADAVTGREEQFQPTGKSLVKAYLVRPAVKPAENSSGFLHLYTDAVHPPAVLLLELPTFRKSEELGMLEFQLDFKCFEKILLPLMFEKSDYSSSGDFALLPGASVRKADYPSADPNDKSDRFVIHGLLPESVLRAQRNSVSVKAVIAKAPLTEYRFQIHRGSEGAPPPVRETTPVFIYNKQCVHVGTLNLPSVEK